MIKLNNLIIKTANVGLKKINRDYTMPAGHNGPYHDSETPVRNSSHWLIIFAKAYEISGDDKYKKAVKRIADYLISNKARSFGYSFYHRKNPHKDKCNGLIGQAWTMEALKQASITLNDTKYEELAKEVFLQHKFNQEYCLWHILEIDGKVLDVDTTFNHQLWFAAIGSTLKSLQDSKIKEEIRIFLDNLANNITIMNNGLIFHPIERIWEKQIKGTMMDKFKRILVAVKPKNILQINYFLKRIILSKKNLRRIKKDLVYKSIGYHSFNMYAFAILKQNLPEHPFWKYYQFLKSIKYLSSKEYIKELEKNKYGFPYNPPGFEIPFALYKFGGFKGERFKTLLSYWIGEQLKQCYNAKNGLMDRNTEDPETHTARVYELTRFMDYVK